MFVSLTYYCWKKDLKLLVEILSMMLMTLISTTTQSLDYVKIDEISYFECLFAYKFQVFERSRNKLWAKNQLIKPNPSFQNNAHS